jgi:hypothetical protein
MKNNQKIELNNRQENGQSTSPIFLENVNYYLIDIDSTVCDDIPNERPEQANRDSRISSRRIGNVLK